MVRRLAVVSIAMALGLLVVGAYALAPVSLEGLSQARPAALAKYKGSGCGVASTQEASRTTFYEGLRLTAKEQTSLEKELLGQGYVKTVSPNGTLYQKQFGSLMSVRSSVFTGAKGVICSAVRSKWSR